MRIDPDFLDHWKTHMLVNLLGEAVAPLYCLRLWAHCQTRKTSCFENYSSRHLAAVCKYSGKPDVLESAMIEAGFVRREGDMLIAHQWEDYNTTLVTSWNNGKFGGRPPKEKPTGLTYDNPRVSVGIPVDNPPQTDGNPTDNPTQTDGEPEDNLRGGRVRVRNKDKNPPNPLSGECDPILLSDSDGGDREAELYERIRRLFGLRPSTLTPKADAKWKRLVKAGELEAVEVSVAVLERAYAEKRNNPPAFGLLCRTSLETLLNHFWDDAATAETYFSGPSGNTPRRENMGNGLPEAVFERQF